MFPAAAQDGFDLGVKSELNKPLVASFHMYSSGNLHLLQSCLLARAYRAVLLDSGERPYHRDWEGIFRQSYECHRCTSRRDCCRLQLSCSLQLFPSNLLSALTVETGYRLPPQSCPEISQVEELAFVPEQSFPAGAERQPKSVRALRDSLNPPDVLEARSSIQSVGVTPNHPVASAKNEPVILRRSSIHAANPFCAALRNKRY